MAASSANVRSKVLNEFNQAIMNSRQREAVFTCGPSRTEAKHPQPGFLSHAMHEPACKLDGEDNRPALHRLLVPDQCCASPCHSK